MTLAPRPAQEPAGAAHLHHEWHDRRPRCAQKLRQRVTAREGSATSEGERVRAHPIRSVPLGHVLTHVLPCTPRAAWLPNPDSHFFYYQSCTTPQAASKLAEHLRGGGALRSCGWSGARVREEAPECMCALPWRCGRVGRVWIECERRRARMNGRVCVHVSDSATLVPVRPSHGPNWGTGGHYEKLKTMSKTTLCRVGDAVVSGGRETRHHSIPHRK